MPCSATGQKTILAIAEAALTTFEGILPVLQSAGKVNPTTATQVQTYVDAANSTLNNVIADLKTNTTPLSKVQATLQTLVQESNQFASLEPANVMLVINLSNTMVQAIINAIQVQQAPAVIAPAGTIAPAAKTEETPIHAGLLEKFNLDHMSSRFSTAHKGITDFLGHNNSTKIPTNPFS